MRKPQARKLCFNHQVYWYDSCDKQQSIAQPCADEDFCKGCTVEDELCDEEAVCIKPFYNGSWLVKADPDKKDACGLGNSTYFDLDLELTVDGGVATAVGNAPGLQVPYEGTVVGKKLSLTGKYKDTSGIEHTEQIDVTFTSPTTFEGYDQDTFTLLGPCTLIWDITGTKQ